MSSRRNGGSYWTSFALGASALVIILWASRRLASSPSSVQR